MLLYQLIQRFLYFDVRFDRQSRNGASSAVTCELTPRAGPVDADGAGTLDIQGRLAHGKAAMIIRWSTQSCQ